MPVTEPKEYWFARRFPFGDRRGAMAPVHWKGWAVSFLFVIALMLGGVAFAWFGAQDDLLKGAAIFVVVAFFATIWFIGTSQRKGDLVRTVADYKKDRTGV